ncbi:MAG: hypothetical protein ACXQS4_00670 [Methermicoccaceae archaeon]
MRMRMDEDKLERLAQREIELISRAVSRQSPIGYPQYEYHHVKKDGAGQNTTVKVVDVVGEGVLLGVVLEDFPSPSTLDATTLTVVVDGEAVYCVDGEGISAQTLYDWGLFRDEILPLPHISRFEGGITAYDAVNVVMRHTTPLPYRAKLIVKGTATTNGTIHAWYAKKRERGLSGVV